MGTDGAGEGVGAGAGEGRGVGVGAGPVGGPAGFGFTGDCLPFEPLTTALVAGAAGCSRETGATAVWVPGGGVCGNGPTLTISEAAPANGRGRCSEWLPPSVMRRTLAIAASIRADAVRLTNRVRVK